MTGKNSCSTQVLTSDPLLLRSRLTHLQPDEVPAPGITSTFLVRLPVHLYNISLGRVLNKQTPEHIAWEAEGGDEEDEDDATAALKEAVQPNANGETRRRKAKARS